MDIYSKSFKIKYTLILISIMVISSIEIGGREFYWLGIFPILSILGGAIGNIIITTLSYIFLPKSLTGLLIVLGITLVILIIGHLLSYLRPWFNFRVLTNIYALVIIIEAIMHKSVHTSISFFNIAIAVVVYIIWAAIIFWKDMKDEMNRIIEWDSVFKSNPVNKIDNHSVHTTNTNNNEHDEVFAINTNNHEHDEVFAINRDYQNVDEPENSSDKIPNVIDPNKGLF